MSLGQAPHNSRGRIHGAHPALWYIAVCSSVHCVLPLMPWLHGEQDHMLTALVERPASGEGSFCEMWLR